MKSRPIKISTLLLLLLLNWYSAVNASKSIEQAGDVLQIMIPGIAYASTLSLNDKNGQIQFYKSMTTTLLITYGLKNTVNKKRPNGGIHSFPSGHSSVAFQGAAFIHQRYGFKYSIPAYLAATFVGYSRVESRYHYNEDVIAGAAIGILSNIYYTMPYHKISVIPVYKNGGIGVQISKHL